MIGATAKAEQFHTRSGNESTKGSRRGFSLLGGGEDPTKFMTDDQRLMAQRSSLVSRLRELELDMQAERTVIRVEAVRKGKDFHRALERRDRLKVEYQRVVLELAQIKEKIGGMHKGLVFEPHFIDVCRETLTKQQFKSILAEAYARAKKSQEEPA